MIANPHQTPAGLIVSGQDYDALVKAEARSLQKQPDKNASRFFSNYAFQNMVAYGAREKPAGTINFESLRQAASKSFVDKILIRARKDQMKSIWQRAIDSKQKQPGFKVVHDRAEDKDFEVTDDINKRCREMEEFLSNPTPVEHVDVFPHGVRVHNGLKDLVSRLIAAELVIDRKVIRRYNRRDGKGYAAFHWLPGDTIKNVDESVGEWAEKNEPGKKITRNTVKKMSYDSGFDISQSAYVQMVDGMVVEAYTEDEISVHISNPSDELNRWGYGESRLELSLDLTTTLLYAWQYNKEIFKTDYPESIISIVGDYDKEGLAAFKQQVLGESGGVGNWHRSPVIAAGEGVDKQNFKVETMKLRDTPKDMMYDQLFRFMIMFKCAAYGAHPTLLNFSTDGGGQGGLFGHNPKDEIAESKEHGLKPSLLDFCEWWTQDLIKPRYDDLKLVLVGLDDDNEKEVLELREKRGKNYITRNEARMEEGLKPIGDMNDQKNPWNFPNDAPIPNYLNTFDMEGGGEGGEGEDLGDDLDVEEEDTEGAEENEGKTLFDKKPAEDEDIEKSQRETKFLKITVDG